VAIRFGYSTLRYRKYVLGGFKNSATHGDNQTGASANRDVASFLRVQNDAHRYRSSQSPVTGVFVVVGIAFGLAFGSFLNVVVYRTPRHLSVVRPASFCPSCGAEIESRDNVPVFAWLWLRGKCRHCKAPISLRYPMVEAGTAAAFAGIAATIRPLWGVPGWWLLATTIGVAAIIEVDGQAVPLGVTIVGGLLGAAGIGIGAIVAGHWGPLSDASVGLGAGTLSAGALFGLSQVRARLSAIWSIPAWGACLGWLGAWPAAIGCAITLVCIGLAMTRLATKSRFVRVPIAACASAGLIAALIAAGIRS
jgi:leader peptidase (prepilin peptidase)/N-methyltransferase